jgi:hypothetical protein
LAAWIPMTRAAAKTSFSGPALNEAIADRDEEIVQRATATLWVWGF